MYDECEHARGYVVQHDTCAARKAFELTDGWRLQDVEQAEEKEGEGSVGPVGRDCDECNKLAGDLIDDHVAGVFAAGFPGHDGGGGDADQCGANGSYSGL